MKLLIICDHLTWATGNLSWQMKSALEARGWEVDVSHKHRAVKHMETKQYDVVYAWIWHWSRNILDDFHTLQPGATLKIGVSGYKKLRSSIYWSVMLHPSVDGVVTWAKILYDKIHEDHPNFWLCRHGVDIDKFRGPRYDGPFRAGWIGNVTHSKKRTHILSRLNHPVYIHGLHVPRAVGDNLIKDTEHLPLDRLQEVYRNFDVLTCVSSAETGPLPILEAASYGLPVVSTAVGIAPELLPRRWLIYEVFDETHIVKRMNDMLNQLKEDPDLALLEGHRNRREILRNWTWGRCVDRWEKFLLD